VARSYQEVFGTPTEFVSKVHVGPLSENSNESNERLVVGGRFGSIRIFCIQRGILLRNCGRMGVGPLNAMVIRISTRQRKPKVASNNLGKILGNRPDGQQECQVF
jgi:hypothetical protein